MKVDLKLICVVFLVIYLATESEGWWRRSRSSSRSSSSSSRSSSSRSTSSSRRPSGRRSWGWKRRRRESRSPKIRRIRIWPSRKPKPTTSPPQVKTTARYGTFKTTQPTRCFFRIGRRCLWKKPAKSKPTSKPTTRPANSPTKCLFKSRICWRVKPIRKPTCWLRFFCRHKSSTTTTSRSTTTMSTPATTTMSTPTTTMSTSTTTMSTPTTTKSTPTTTKSTPTTTKSTPTTTKSSPTTTKSTPTTNFTAVLPCVGISWLLSNTSNCSNVWTISLPKPRNIYVVFFKKVTKVQAVQIPMDLCNASKTISCLQDYNVTTSITGDTDRVMHSGIVVTTEDNKKYLIHKSKTFASTIIELADESMYTKGYEKIGPVLTENQIKQRSVMEYYMISGEGYNFIKNNSNDATIRMINLAIA